VPSANASLAGPAEDLHACVVVPARNEAARIGACIHALSCQVLVVGSFEVILVLDDCHDGTGVLARRAAAHGGPALRCIAGPGRGSGAARQAGMEFAARRLEAVARPDGLIACTDADTRVWPDWLVSQQRLVLAGARAVAGRIELEPHEAAELSAEVMHWRTRDARRRLARVRADAPDAEHHHFGGASFAVTAEVYRAVGGLEPHASLEDAAFAERLRAHQIPIVRSRRVGVTTSARADGRAVHGLAEDLALAEWMATRRYRAHNFEPATLRDRKGATDVAVILPAREVADSIGRVIEETVDPLRAAGLVDELIVVDARSPDGTGVQAERAGARVIQQDEILAEHGPALGKGDAMWRAVAASSAQVVCFLDADTTDPVPEHLLGLLGPLLTDPSIMLVKGAFDRPRRVAGGELPGEGGRVTELMARPLLNLHEPRLAGFTQPLAGETAARRELLERLPFPVGYGVEIGMLIDSLRACGLSALAECWLGTRGNRHQPLRALGEMAYAVLAAVQRRTTPLAPANGHILQPWNGADRVNVPIAERPPLNTLHR
jgi:glycosyltransferase involved in cell wall biosynthesis